MNGSILVSDVRAAVQHSHTRSESSRREIHGQCDLVVFAHDVAVSVQIESRDNAARSADLYEGLASAGTESEKSEGRADACESFEPALMQIAGAD